MIQYGGACECGEDSGVYRAGCERRKHVPTWAVMHHDAECHHMYSPVTYIVVQQLFNVNQVMVLLEDNVSRHKSVFGA
jgi:hypothetical protein